MKFARNFGKADIETIRRAKESVSIKPPDCKCCCKKIKRKDVIRF